jgi:hypothetical protein
MLKIKYDTGAVVVRRSKKMSIIDADAALREPIDEPQPASGHPFSSREADRTHPEVEPPGHASRRHLNTGVGWIEVVRPERTGAPAPEDSITLSLPQPHDELSSARGIAFGAALGLTTWAMIGGLIGMFLF